MRILTTKNLEINPWNFRETDLSNINKLSIPVDPYELDDGRQVLIISENFTKYADYVRISPILVFEFFDQFSSFFSSFCFFTETKFWSPSCLFSSVKTEHHKTYFMIYKTC